MNYILLFLVLLLPNFMRQLDYLKSYKKTKGFGFCVSPETRTMHKKRYLPWSGFLEEIGWGIAWTIAWFLGFKWLAFGWVSDAIIDCFIAYLWRRGVRKGILFAGARGSFFVREILLPYLIAGPLLYALGADIFIYSLISAGGGVILWLMM